MLNKLLFALDRIFWTVFVPLKRKYVRLVNVWGFFLFMPEHCARDISIRGTVVMF